MTPLQKKEIIYHTTNGFTGLSCNILFYIFNFLERWMDVYRVK